MRKGWEYKKLGEIITPAKVIKNGDRMDYPILSITMRSGIILQNERFKKTIASVDISNYKVVQNGQLVIAFPIDEGLIYTQDIVEAGIMSPAYNIWNVDYSEMNRCFLVAYLHSPYAMSYYKSKLRGTTMRRRSIPKADLLNLTVPFPSLDKQVKIIEELDKINELIRLKKEQLKDFDNLAQSLFYEMFGDPVENEKGWEVKKLIEVSTLINGRAYKQNELLSEGKYKVLRVGNFFTNSNFYYSNLELEDEKYCYKGDLLFAWSASFGAFIWDEDKTIFHYHIWRVLFDKTRLDIHYYQYLLNTMTSFFMNDVHGIGMVHLTKSGMEQYELPLPPLPLQRLFAQRIEQIEREKSEVQKSIQDLETLLASRMQYWFE